MSKKYQIDLSWQCDACKHTDRDNVAGMTLIRVPRTCKAFPEGIPSKIESGKFDHTNPYEGDHGVRFERAERAYSRSSTFGETGITGLVPDTITPSSKTVKGWSYEKSVAKCRNLFKTVRVGGTELILEFLHAHEQLVSKKVPGKTWGGFCKQVGIDPGTPINWFKRYQLSYSQTRLNKPEISGIAKPLKKHTKSDTKIHIDELSKEIQKGNVSDDDTKIIGDAIAESIKDGKSAIRVGTRIETAVKKKRNSFAKRDVKNEPTTNMDRLQKHIMSAMDGLTFLADGEIKPEGEDDKTYFQIIQKAGPNIILQYARLGIDVMKAAEFATSHCKKGQTENGKQLKSANIGD